MVVFGKGVVFGQSSLVRSKVVVFGLKWLYSGKSECIGAKVDDFDKSGYFWAR